MRLLGDLLDGLDSLLDGGWLSGWSGIRTF
jgi:hypothetical protein